MKLNNEIMENKDVVVCDTDTFTEMTENTGVSKAIVGIACFGAGVAARSVFGWALKKIRARKEAKKDYTYEVDGEEVELVDE